MKWRDSFDLLEDAGCVSAYHAFTGVPHGEEPIATHYFLTRRERPFHIDFCFVPRAWQLDDVSIASFEEFASLSDHRPITTTFRTP